MDVSVSNFENSDGLVFSCYRFDRDFKVGYVDIFISLQRNTQRLYNTLHMKHYI